MSPRPGYIYFIQEGARGPVKIGWAADPTFRLGNIQAGNSRRLHIRKLIPAIDQVYEFDFHRFYAEHRVAREWFKPVVLEIEPPVVPGPPPKPSRPELPLRLCGECRVPWEKHERHGCGEWVIPELRQNPRVRMPSSRYSEPAA